MSRVFARWPRRLAWLGISVGVLLALSACAPAAPPTSDLAQDLLATQVSLALTQTAVAAAAPALPSALPSPTPLLPTPTALPIPTASPTAAPTAVPTAVPTLPPPPYDGPCTPELTTSDVTPTWGDWDSYRGYRFSGKVLEGLDVPYTGFLLPAGEGLPEGFAMEVYALETPRQLVIFAERLVCYQGPHPYFEVTDVLALPTPAMYQALSIGPGLYAHEADGMGTSFWGDARPENPMAFLGLVLGVDCTPPVPRVSVVQMEVDPAVLPAVYTPDTRVPVQVTQAWYFDAAGSQRLVPLDSSAWTCQTTYGP